MSLLESQITTRERLNKKMTERAYLELATSVGRAPRTFTVDNVDVTDDDAAIKTCLAHCGVTAGDIPDEITDLEERIGYACRPTGTMYRKVTLKGNWYHQAFGALLGKLDTGELVALLPMGLHSYGYYDPHADKRVKINAEVAKHIQPQAVQFYPPLPARALKIRDLLIYIFKIFDRSDYLLVGMATLAVNLIGLLPAWANNIAYGTVIKAGTVDLIAPIAALLVGVTISSTLIDICRTLVMSRLSIKLDVNASAATFARALMLPTNFFKQYASGDLASRLSTMTRLAQSMVSIVLGFGLSIMLSLVYVLQISAYAPMLTIPALAIILLEAWLTIAVTHITASYEQDTMKRSAELSGTVTALLSGIQKIKLAGAEDRAFAKWAHGYAGYARSTYNRPTLLNALPAMVGLVSLLGNIAIYYLAGSNNLSVADYMSFNVAFGQATAAVMALSNAAGQFAMVRPMLEMARPLLEAEPETSDEKPNVASITGGIEVSDVAFRYEETSPYVVHDLSFKIRPGEYIALVGKSGCGKSTIMRLLLGFEKPERGTIFYGPYDVTKVDARSLRRHIGTVMQDGKLFLGNIYSNITISNPQATLDDAWEAAELAGIADDIHKMPMGMQTLVTEGGGGISGGQRQRLMIARAICGKRRILMFDEATSALDNKTQRHVSDSLDSLKCTRLVIAHRLSTVKHCDRILVVDDGHIAEQGTYDELIAKDGLFADLVARQRLEGE